MMCVRARAPGKLMLMGEYAVTEPGHVGLVAAVDRYLYCQVTSGNTFSASFGTTSRVEADGWGRLVDRLTEDPDLKLASRVLALLDRYFWELHCAPRPFQLATTSELRAPSGEKYGLGSSAAATAAMVAALLQWTLPRSPRPQEIFKLASLAHFSAQPRGSLADVAASVFGGLLHYQRVDPEWLYQAMSSHALPELIARPWPGLAVQTLDAWRAPLWLVGWTGRAASTPALLGHAAQFRARHPDVFNRFLSQSDAAVAAFIQALHTDDGPQFMAAVRKNRQALAEFSDRAQLQIETPMMTKALEMAEQWGGAGKSSGAGGGDIIVAWMPESQRSRLGQAWNRQGIELLAVNLDTVGVVLSDADDFE
ncbi:MAG: phosphomevalonate kinase [Thermaerobacter sp.]|nr:phosphomevalonate kinase [Thermaerobacter sp.]